MIQPRPYQRCTRCVMDTSDPDIHFDGEGCCNHCNTLLQHRGEKEAYLATGVQKLEALVHRIQQAGRGKEHDCILGLSGGVDSSYAAYLLKELGLRPLFVHMDNGWNAEEAVLNIKRLADGLKLDYESFVLDWEEFRDLQLAFLRASVVEAETPTDMGIPGALHRIAARHGIKYIISGGNLATEGILPAYWHYNAKDARYLRAIHKRFGTRPLRNFPIFGFKEEAYYKLVHGIRIVYPLNLVPFTKERATTLLVDKLGWTPYGGKHHESLYTRFVQSYLLPVKFGIDYRKATYSSQICDGELTRDEAITFLQQPVYDVARIEGDLNYVAKKLRISREELDAIVALPAKSHLDYPNDEQRLKVIYNLYRRFFPRV